MLIMKALRINIGHKIYKLRIKSHMTQRQLAEEIGVLESSIRNWENGVCLPKPSCVYKLATYFKVTSDSLIGLKRRNR